VNERSRNVHAGHESDGEFARDVSALVSETSRGLPDVFETVRRARNRATSRAGGPSMAAIRFFWMRPALSGLLAVALGLFVVLGLPIPFEKTTGHDVTLALSGAGLDEARAAQVAREMKSLLAAESVRLEMDATEAGATYRLTARVAERSGPRARRQAQALAAGLQGAGLQAAATVTPRTERVAGTMYAFAADRILRISTDGKSASQLEAEIRDGLAAAGFGDAQVTVRDQGDGRREVGIEVRREGDAPSGEEMPEIVLTKDGQDVGADGERCQVKIRNVRREGEAARMIVDIARDGRTVTAEIANAETMSDAELRREIQSQLDEAGVDVRVDVVDGEVRVEGR
jgi:hypothetical protein